MGALLGPSWGAPSAPPVAQKPRKPGGEADYKKKKERRRSEKHFSAQDRPKELFIKIVDFLLKMLVFHWKSVCLEPTEAF